jgi:hypothetical protein
MRVLVYGGRDFTNKRLAFNALDLLHKEYGFTLVIDGMARGADTLGFKWAQDQGLPSERYPADWNRYQNAAGPIRNQQMIDDGKPDIAVAFPGGNGTSDMTKRLLSHGILVKTIVVTKKHITGN